MMKKAMAILFMFPLMCCSSDKNQQHKQIEQVEKICDSSCENEKIKIEYEKKFGIPISNFELSIKKVRYRNIQKKSSLISVSKTTTGALAEHRGVWTKYIPIELSSEEWLDFINALYKSHVNEWERVYDVTEVTFGGSLTLTGWLWNLEIFTSDKDSLESCGAYLYPPDWDKFIKIMEDMKERVKKDTKNKYR
jgi:hypothetical protein